MALVHSLNSPVRGKSSTILATPWPVPFNQRLQKPPSEIPVNVVRPFLETLDLSKCQLDTPTPQTVSPAGSEPTSPEHRIDGLTWHTPGIINSCHMDSFLSALVLNIRQTHGNFLNKIQHRDLAADAIGQIAELVLTDKNNVDSEMVKELWLRHVFDKPLSKPLDISGYEKYSIFQHLTSHSTTILELKCLCGVQYNCLPMIQAWSVNDLNKILLNDTTSHLTSLPTCADCGNTRQLVNFKPSRTNWMLTISFPNPLIANFNDFMPVIEVNNVMYKISYLSYCLIYPNSFLAHHFSYHYIRGFWYHYDDSFKKFKLSDSQIRCDIPNSYLEGVVYFRI